MQEQNFEKEVRQRMQELLLQPSPPVWRKVAAAIAEKKKKRRFLFWMIPLLLAAGSGGIWYYNGTSEVETSQDTVRQTTIASRPKRNTTTKQPIKEKQVGEAAKILPPTEQPGVTMKATERMKYENTFAQPSAARGGRKGASSNKKYELSSQNIESMLSPGPATLSYSAEPGSGTVKDSPSQLAPIVIERDTQLAKPNNSLPPAPDSAVVTPQKKQKPVVSKKWNWLIHTSAGFSNTTSHLFTNPTAIRADFSSGTGSVPMSFSAPPSPIRKSTTYAVGINIKKALNKNLSLVAGFYYSQYSTKQLVGAASSNDTSVLLQNNQRLKVNGFYRPGTLNDIRNNYHYLELPLAIEIKPVKHLPLYLQSGVSLAYMISSKALVYQPQNRLYYRSPAAYNRAGAHLRGAVQYGFSYHKKVALYAGPYIQYSLTNLESGGTNKNRLRAFGLTTQVSL